MNIIYDIDEQINALRKRKAAIQQACSHPDKTSVNKGSGGDVMTGREEIYWTTHVCNLCGHKWDTNQGEPSHE